MTSKDMACGIDGGEPAPLSAKVSPGDTISVDWGFWPGSHLVNPSFTKITIYLPELNPNMCAKFCRDQ